MNDERRPQEQRFGHYRALAALEGRGEAALWHAWDPYLGRFVLVASLAGVDTDRVRAALADLDGALRRWTGVASFSAADVLHFFPGSDSEDAWLVLQLPSAPAAATAGTATGPAPAPRRDAVLVAALVLAGLAILGLPLLLYLLSGRGPAATPPPVVVAPTATATACAPATPSPTTTPAPTATAKPAPPARKAAAAAPARRADVGAPIEPAPPAAETPVAHRAPAEPEGSGAVQTGSVTAMTRRMAGADTLVREWLLRHCHEVERAYLAAGRNFACGWMGVTIAGDLPELTVSFTRIERHLQTGRDLYTNRSVRLLCTDQCIPLQDAATTAEVH